MSNNEVEELLAGRHEMLALVGACVDEMARQFDNHRGMEFVRPLFYLVWASRTTAGHALLGFAVNYTHDPRSHEVAGGGTWRVPEAYEAGCELGSDAPYFVRGPEQIVMWGGEKVDDAFRVAEACAGPYCAVFRLRRNQMTKKELEYESKERTEAEWELAGKIREVADAIYFDDRSPTDDELAALRKQMEELPQTKAKKAIAKFFAELGQHKRESIDPRNSSSSTSNPA